MRARVSAVMLVTCVACGTHARIKIDDLIQQIDIARCDDEVACVRMPDEATCLTTVFSDNIALTVVADVHRGTVHYDEELGADCVDELRTMACVPRGGAYYSDLLEMYLDASSACVRMLSGTVPDLAACNESAECAKYGYCSGPACDRYTSCCAGSCGSEGVATDGQDCSGVHCAAGLYCDTTTFKCAALVTTVGAPCYGSDACKAPLVCQVPARTNSGTCAASPPLSDTGGPCPCKNVTDFCDMTTRVCTPKAQIGQPCSTDAFCIDYAGCLNGTCVALPGPGDACTVGPGALGCLGRLSCTNSICTFPSPGIACDN